MRASRTARERIEFGDFQTPDSLAMRVCSWLVERGVSPAIAIEPTCGVGSILAAAAQCFPEARALYGFEIDPEYAAKCRSRCEADPRIEVDCVDFFRGEWKSRLAAATGEMLIVGNLPWVTNSTQGGFDGANLPTKSNFQGRRGIDAITGAANFDVSEWMLLEACSWFSGRSGTLAILIKRSVARRVIERLAKTARNVDSVAWVEIDALAEFDASVGACLFVVRFAAQERVAFDGDYRVFASFDDRSGSRQGTRDGLAVRDLEAYERHRRYIGTSAMRWRSGIKHDAKAVMELVRREDGFVNGLGQRVEIEPDLVFPLRKGSELGTGKPWGERFVIVPQRRVGEPTDTLSERCPRTYEYLLANASILDARRSSIYAKNPRFSIFGIGEYSFAPFKIAICGLYKRPAFRLEPLIEGRPVMFDDTTNFLSFDDDSAAREALACLESCAVRELLDALIFPDDKRPVKASILNRIDFAKALTP